MRYEHVDDVSLHTYIDTYIHRYSEFAICYSCIRGSLRLAPNYSLGSRLYRLAIALAPRVLHYSASLQLYLYSHSVISTPAIA